MADAKVIPFGEEPRARRKARRAGRTERGTALAPVPEARTEHLPAVPRGRTPGGPWTSGSRAGWRSCAGGSPATTRSTTSGTTRS